MTDRPTRFIEADRAIDAWENVPDANLDEAIEHLIATYENTSPDVKDYIVHSVGSWVRG